MGIVKIELQIHPR